MGPLLLDGGHGHLQVDDRPATRPGTAVSRTCSTGGRSTGRPRLPAVGLVLSDVSPGAVSHGAVLQTARTVPRWRSVTCRSGGSNEVVMPCSTAAPSGQQGSPTIRPLMRWRPARPESDEDLRDVLSGAVVPQIGCRVAARGPVAVHRLGHAFGDRIHPASVAAMCSTSLAGVSALVVGRRIACSSVRSRTVNRRKDRCSRRDSIRSAGSRVREVEPVMGSRSVVLRRPPGTASPGDTPTSQGAPRLDVAAARRACPGPTCRRSSGRRAAAHTPTHELREASFG